MCQSYQQDSLLSDTKISVTSVLPTTPIHQGIACLTSFALTLALGLPHIHSFTKVVLIFWQALGMSDELIHQLPNYKIPSLFKRD